MNRKIQEFILYIKEKKQASENTLSSYERDLKRAAVFFEGKGLSDVNEITTDQLREYLTELEGKAFSKATLSRNVASLHTFFHFLLIKKYITDDPSEELRAPKAERKKQTVLSLEQIACLLKQPDEDTQKGVRDKAMLELLCSTGISVSDLICLSPEDVNLQNSYIVAGEEKEHLYFDESTLKILRRYLGETRPSLLTGRQSPYLFMNYAGEPMSRQGFSKILKGYAKKAGLLVNVTPQILRHSHVVYQTLREMGMKNIQQTMADSDI